MMGHAFSYNSAYLNASDCSYLFDARSNVRRQNSSICERVAGASEGATSPAVSLIDAFSDPVLLVRCAIGNAAAKARGTLRKVRRAQLTGESEVR